MARGSVFERAERDGCPQGYSSTTYAIMDLSRRCPGYILDMFVQSELVFELNMNSFKVPELDKQIAPECRIDIVRLRLGDSYEKIDGLS